MFWFIIVKVGNSGYYVAYIFLAGIFELLDEQNYKPHFYKYNANFYINCFANFCLCYD